MVKINRYVIRNMAATFLCAVITSVGIVLVEVRFYVGLLFIGIGVVLFSKQMKGLHGEKEENTINKG